MNRNLRAPAASLLAICLLATGPAFAAGSQSSGATGANAAAEDQTDAQQLVNEAVGVVKQMEQDPQLKQAMAKAKGVYILPDFGRGALGIGGRGGTGVMLSHQDGAWTGPLFFDMGGISVGAQAGASAGSVAFLLMTDEAVNEFKSDNQFSLNADAGFTIVDYSANAQASWGKGDIILWSDTEGAYAGAAISVTDINRDDDNNRTYYDREVDPAQVLNGEVTNPDAEPLKDALPA